MYVGQEHCTGEHRRPRRTGVVELLIRVLQMFLWQHVGAGKGQAQFPAPTCWLTTVCNSTPGDSTPSSGFWGHQTHTCTVYANSHRQRACIYEIKINKRQAYHFPKPCIFTDCQSHVAGKWHNPVVRPDLRSKLGIHTYFLPYLFHAFPPSKITDGIPTTHGESKGALEFTFFLAVLSFLPARLLPTLSTQAPLRLLLLVLQHMLKMYPAGKHCLHCSQSPLNSLHSMPKISTSL